MRKLSLEIFYFGVSGILGYVVDVAALYLVMDGVGLYFGRVFSFLMAASFTWVFNRFITFRTRTSRFSIGYEYRTYLLFMLAGASVNYGIYVLALQVSSGVPPYLAVALGSFGGMWINFFLSRNLLFKDQA